MSSRLSDLVAQAMEENTVAGRCDTALATASLRERLDEEHIDAALNAYAGRLISAARRRSD